MLLLGSPFFFLSSFLFVCETSLRFWMMKRRFLYQRAGEEYHLRMDYYLGIPGRLKFFILPLSSRLKSPSNTL